MKPAMEYDMSKFDIVDEIIQQLSPEYIPHEYILMAKVRMDDNTEELIEGDKLSDFISEHNDHISGVSVLLDINGIKAAINAETERVLREAQIL